MQKMTFEIEGQSYTGEVENIQGTLWIHLNGKNFSLESETKGRRRKKGSGGGGHPGQIIANMPGKVTRVFVEEGQGVSVGESVLVLEAMKMEYTLKAAEAGQVEKVSVKVDDQVTAGKILVKISVVNELKEG